MAHHLRMHVVRVDPGSGFSSPRNRASGPPEDPTPDIPRKSPLGKEFSHGHPGLRLSGQRTTRRAIGRPPTSLSCGRATGGMTPTPPGLNLPKVASMEGGSAIKLRRSVEITETRSDQSYETARAASKRRMKESSARINWPSREYCDGFRGLTSQYHRSGDGTECGES